MKSYLSLIPISAKINKKQNKMTMVCIILAVFLVTAIFSMADMEIRSQKIKAIKDYGNWHIALKNISEKDAGILSARSDIAAASWYNTLNYRLKDGYFINGKDAVICGTEQSLLNDIMPDSIEEGQYPTDDNQIILTQNAKDILKVSIGDTIEINLPSGERINYIISGFGMDSSMISQADAIGAFLPMPAFKNIYSSAENKELLDSDMIYYVQFDKNVNIRRAIEDIKKQYGFTEDNISRNTALLGTMGYSNDSYMLGLYGSAFVLFLLVLIAGVLMIASSLNSNISQRTKFFGMLRCIGAEKKQIIRFVRLEALNWCKAAIPIGVILGVLVVWVLCSLLKFLSGSYFEDMPVFGISYLGIISGIAVGLLTVLMSAQSPAKKAAKVSPLSAITGSYNNTKNVYRAAGTNLFKVDTGLGIYHAKMNIKNFILMTGSFALSIVLFLAFSAVVSFMNHAIKPLKPYTPDVSIISPDNTCSVNRDLTAELSGLRSVKRVYGRSFKYNMPVKINGSDRKIDLISYESNQFNWADKKNYILEGDLSKVLGNSDYVLAVYSNENSLHTGDKINLGNETVSISGVLSTCPFESEQGTETIICSEETFKRITGEKNYTIIDIQLTNQATDADVNYIRGLAGSDITFSDRRLSNKEVRGAFLAFALFIYGFILIIALITVFNIINSISMSVSSKIKQYASMIAIGMEKRQTVKMITAEAVTYAVTGSILGSVLGLPIHKFMFSFLVTQHWGDTWQIPLSALFIIIFVVLLSSFAAVYGPAKRIHDLEIAAVINTQ